MDIDYIAPGEDFVQVIENAVGSCEILITIIGKRWLSSAEDTSRRIDNPNDFVRLEIVAALDRDIRVIPVLVQGATMPQARDLPEDLSKLSRRQGFELSDLRWRRDVDQLIGALEKILAQREEARRESDEELRRLATEAANRAQEVRRLQQARTLKEEADNGAEAEEGAEAQARQKTEQLAARKREEAEAAKRESEEMTRAEQLARAEEYARRQRVNLPTTVLDPPGPTIADGHAMLPTERPISAGPQIEMVLIPAGTFTMGSPNHEVGRVSNEGPQRQVSVQSFYMGKYEVTQVQYQAVMGTHSSYFKGHSSPVESVSWNDAVEFCRKLSQMTGEEYRLPSEAEWEYACRAGTETPFAFGSSLSSEQANFDGNHPYGGAANGMFRKKTTPVGSFQPNAFGLYDMHGNVWEWCQDWYHDTNYAPPTDGSAWLSGTEQEYRMIRGGSWYSSATNVRSAYRARYTPVERSNRVGFRVVGVAITEIF